MLFACVLALLAASGLEEAQAADGALAARIDAHVDAPRFEGASWGIQAVSLDSGKTLYARDAGRLLVPASAAKLFTGALALDALGPDHRIATSLLASARPDRNGMLRGDLILYGYGDPSLGTDLHDDWAAELAGAAWRAGIRTVDGDLVADATRFSAPAFGAGWEAADLQSWFGAPAMALNIGENVARVLVRPAARAGEAAHVRFEPPSFGPAFVLDNALLTVAAPARSDISLARQPGSARLHAFGTVAAGARESAYRIALPDPALMAGQALRQALADRGIEVAGTLRSVAWPDADRARPAEPWRVADTWSPPLAELLERGFKVSQNLYLQAMLLMVGAAEEDRLRAVAAAAGTVPPPFRTTEQLGVTALGRYLARFGIAPSEISVEEGAGLSRRNLASASGFVKFLVALADDPAARPFRTALPVAGGDGTLAGRLRNEATRGRIFAKTGAMKNVASLAGYATTAAGERIAFAILLNNYLRPPDAARTSIELDAIVAMLVDAEPQHQEARLESGGQATTGLK
ncbi:MAG: D-alanyl-D-alanine carboxypeptidase/D-alanyl-D-alanine-endopeptidase [Xanthomonadales bacterium]|nr:D-alanyl-D-alanine carboxypeptidase/D-alanyl-D-alanine-endopeptidase [Xanthomonadales bacterium]